MASRIRGIDGLRAFSVLAVVLTHLGIYDLLVESGLLGAAAISLLHGAAGVQVFFVISGFIITHLLISEHKNTGSVSLKDFYIRRALRILPLYFLVVFLIIVINFLVWPVVGKPSVLHAMLFFTNFIPRSSYASILGHTWSLAVEEHFYLIWPVLVSIVIAFRWSRIFYCTLLFVLLLSFAYILTVQFTNLSQTFFVERWSFFAGIYIAVGCLVAIVCSAPGFERLRDLLGNRACLPLAITLYVNTVLFGIVHNPLSELVRGAGIGLFLGWIVVNQSSGITRFLEVRPLVYIGQISYGLYMWQGFFLSTGPLRGPDQLWPPDPLLGLLGLCLIAPLSYHFFEKPFLELRGRFRRPAASQGS